MICDGKKLSEVIGLMLIMNLSHLQNRFQYDTWIKQMLPRIMPYAEFTGILHKLKLVCSNTCKNGEWSDSIRMREAYAEACRCFNDKVRVFLREACCYDDDIQPTTSAERAEVASTCIIRKGGWCVVFDCLSNIVDALPCFIHLREHGRSLIQNFMKRFEFKGGELVFYDRGYTNADAASELSTIGICSMAPYKKNMTLDHPFDIYDLKSFDAPLPANYSTRAELGFVALVTYPGVGSNIFVAEDKSRNLISIAVIHRTSQTNDGIIKILCGKGSEHDALKIQNLVNLVRIPKSVSPSHAARTIEVSVRDGDTDAKIIQDHLERNCQVFTHYQRDAAWGCGRKLSFTASQSDPVIRRALKLCALSDFKHVRAALYKSEDEEIFIKTAIDEDDSTFTKEERFNEEVEDDTQILDLNLSLQDKKRYLQIKSCYWK